MTDTSNKCIWYLSKYVCPKGYDGTGTRAFFLMKHFAKLGHTSIILTSDSNHLIKNIPIMAKYSYVENIENVSVHWLKTIKYKKTNSIRRILSWIDFEIRLLFYKKNKIQRPDVIIVSSLSLLTILNGIILKIRYKSKLIFEIRDIWPLTIVAEGKYSKINPLVIALGLIEKLGYIYSDNIVGTMPNLSEHIRNIGVKKVAHCIPMGADIETLSLTSQLPIEYINKYIPKDKFIVMHAGSVGITNALDTLLNSAKKIENSIQDIHFLIIGEGDLISKYKLQYSSLSNLTFAPRVQKDMVQEILGYADLLYFSAFKSIVWKYGQSLNKIIDYMYSGKPIVGSYSGYPSMINEAKCGNFIKPEDDEILINEIVKFYKKDLNELNKIGQRGKQWLLSHRTYDVLAENYLKIIYD